MENVNKVLLGDCLEVMNGFEDNSFDFIFADLPYGTTACKWDIVIPFEELWTHYKRILKNDGVIALTGSEPFSSKLRLSNLEWYRYDWVWDKIQGANFLNLKNRPFKTHENVMIFAPTANFTFNPIRVFRTEKSLKRDKNGIGRTLKGSENLKIEHYSLSRKLNSKLANDGKKHPIDVLKIPTVEKGRYELKHPTKKPVELLRYLISTYTNEGDLVLDNTAGSGTTGVACILENRNYVLIEKEKEYHDLILKRIADLKNKTPLFNQDF